jgi:hypothetical protein
MCLVLRFLSLLLMGPQSCAPNIAVSVSSGIFGFGCDGRNFLATISCNCISCLLRIQAPLVRFH